MGGVARGCSHVTGRVDDLLTIPFRQQVVEDSIY